MTILMCPSLSFTLSESLGLSPLPSSSTGLFIFLSISLTRSSFSVSLHLSCLTAIRHWPCSLCLLPLPQARPSHNYFLWFTVVGHCHPPKVFTAEITHTVFQRDPPPPFHYPPLCPEALVKVGLIINPDIQREQVQKSSSVDEGLQQKTGTVTIVCSVHILYRMNHRLRPDRKMIVGLIMRTF